MAERGFSQKRACGLVQSPRRRRAARPSRAMRTCASGCGAWRRSDVASVTGGLASCLSAEALA